MTTEFGGRLVEHLPTLRVYARRLAGNAADGEDLLHDTVLRALTREERWSPAFGSLRQWLTTLCFHQFIDGVRRAKRAKAYHTADVPDTSVEAAQDGIVALRELAEQLLVLPEQQRRIIALAATGETYDAIGKAMKLPRGTIASSLHRARKELAHVRMRRRRSSDAVAADNPPSFRPFHHVRRSGVVADPSGHAEPR